MLPSILAKQLEKGLGDYIETAFPMTNAPFQGSVRKMLETKGSVFHEPYIAVRLPFRVAEKMPACFEAIHPKYLPYLHQQKAFDRLTGDDGRSTLVGTGTGSGKTECFTYPVLEYCYQHRDEPGIKALIIYPMNALASDQAKRMAELIYNSPELRGNVTAGMYVGGETRTASRMMTEHGVITDHDTLLNAPPDILMTNYKMLDYLLIRPKDALLWQDNGSETLKYIAVDELHTFDGAQGTDLACLLRRLKRRLGIYDGFLCCVGTSATMGGETDQSSILEYASEIFGEPFDKDAVITEDRLSPSEFFEASDITAFDIPDALQIAELEELAADDKPNAYLKKAAAYWFPDLEQDVISDAGRLALGQQLMHHSLMQAVINLTGGNYAQVSKIAEALSAHFPELKASGNPSALLNSLFALISHARTEQAGQLRPFLDVQVQLWMRELRRLMAKVDPEKITYEIAHDLNRQQVKHYLPVVNCRDCGATGWVSMMNERGNVTMVNLEAFYNRYFKADKQIAMMFPFDHQTPIPGMTPARLCPNCLQIKFGDSGDDHCSSCGEKMMDVLMPDPVKTTKSKQYICPCCGSERGLSLIGLRAATEISAEISQLFASGFNDDKKLLAFSDNVQDAAHRAGFFNARTWRFGLRTAIQKYISDCGDGLSLTAFQDGFIAYWHERMTDEDFVSFFIAPNMTWRYAYEDMVKDRKLKAGSASQILMQDIEQRLRYEIMLEFGLTAKIGRTLEKSGCAVLSFSPEMITAMAETVQERVVNELGVMTSEKRRSFEQMVLGVLNLMRTNGAFEDPVFDEYTLQNGHGYMLSNERNRWLPGRQSGRNTPRFMAEYSGRGKCAGVFDTPTSKKYIDWIKACRTEIMVEENNFRMISRFILDAGLQQQAIALLPSSADYRIFGLNKDRVTMTTAVVFLRCEKCGSFFAASEANAPLWIGAPCQRAGCNGQLKKSENADLDYYGKLYAAGDLSRVNAREHTGLLDRPMREQLEIDFKRSQDTRAIWDPNVLSCTPTLEMGIDIGDLSTVVLCSMPPAQSQFFQRAGRAGRKDGNALILAVANARPHDLYFYSEPMDMIAGQVAPPKIFLRASAVLERQFVAFCMDSWVKKGLPDDAIPEKAGVILKKIDAAPENLFPFNFLNYVQRTLSRQLNSFTQMFAAYLDDDTREELQIFARGQGRENSPMHIKILDVFYNLKKQYDALHQSVAVLEDLIRELKSKPKDSSFDEDIKNLNSEKAALLNVCKELINKNVFNFMCDEGLLPNYAFPEAGILLRALLYRKEKEAGTSPSESRKKDEKMVYEYNRSAASAISEFAPNNVFYADGHKLTIDQVDLTTAKAAKWRLCPNCSHAQLEETGKHTAACPRCGSPLWADQGQVRTMLKVQMVYSNMAYSRSQISDESDDRTFVFYCRQLLVDVDEDKDIAAAYRMDNEDFPFGYEFVRKATLREINFGESDQTGDKLSVSGVEDVRKGFKICKYCGKIQSDEDKPNHTYFCKAGKKTGEIQKDAYEECLFLYREFNTEVLRLLIPATTMDPSAVKLESFIAAFMLGMKAYFGNVDHLRAAVTEVPVPDAGYRKQYLVIYDSVPGGTGYLKQLMHEKNALIDIFEKALQVMESCNCKEDPRKDGCYHCLYAYRQSRQIGNISRSAAIRMLKSILSGKDHIEKINKINDIPINPLFDSELEQQFMEAIRLKAGSANVSDTIRNGKHSYYLKLSRTTWEIEPQVLLDAGHGVKVTSKPDFVIWPIQAEGHLPVAVFTDGFLYHKDKVADDTVKREAIRRSGHFRVWSLSYRDVQQVFSAWGEAGSAALQFEKMPNGKNYQATAKTFGADDLNPGKFSSFDLLIKYLQMPDAEKRFHAYARTCEYSLLDPNIFKDREAFDVWQTRVEAVRSQTRFTDFDFVFSDTVYGIWQPGARSQMTIYAGISKSALKLKGAAAVCAVLKDEKDRRNDAYEQAWNDFWQFFNLMQFSDAFVAVSSLGLAQMDYLTLPVQRKEALSEAAEPSQDADTSWKSIFELLFDPEAKIFAEEAQKCGIPAPSEESVGYELAGTQGEVIATIEIAWPERKIGYMTAAQTEDRSTVEEMGWQIFDLQHIGDAAAILGGDRS